MTYDEQHPEGDAKTDLPEADRRAAGLVYLVRDQSLSGDGNAESAGEVGPDTDDAADSEDSSVRPGGRAPAGEDWPWVVEWRAGGEPTPWAPGLALTAFSALVVGVAVWVLSAGLVDRPIVAVLVNLLVAGGLAPAMWLSKDLPVLRWIAAGALVGIAGGWIAALMMLPMPTP